MTLVGYVAQFIEHKRKLPILIDMANWNNPVCSGKPVRQAASISSELISAPPAESVASFSTER